jgi:hypothetical protein
VDPLLPVLVERSFVLNILKPKVPVPYSQSVPLLTAKTFSSGHQFFSDVTLDIYSLSGVYFVLFKSSATADRPERWSDFKFPTADSPAVTDVTFQTRNVILAGVCSGINGPVTTYRSGLRVALGSRDQVFVMLGFPTTELWPDPGTSVAMSLTGLLSSAL